MTQLITVSDFSSWRTQARALLAAEVPPAELVWREPGERGEEFLPFATGPAVAARSIARAAESSPLQISREFLEAARQLSCHSDAGRFELLYRIIWRIAHGEPELLKLPLDDDMLRFRGLEKAVHRDCHKMKAFVRFQRVGLVDGQEQFFAFHRPDHKILRLVAPFFARRFGVMRWTIATPWESVRWENQELTFGQGLPAAKTVDEDTTALWITYYESIFNPARLNPRAMTRELPVRHWRTLPETQSIPRLIQNASVRAEAMIEQTEGFAMSAADFLPPSRDLKTLRAASQDCQGCPLFEDATQTVFGEGPASASIVMVGEQPGDREDTEGHPFVGPAGKMLDDALEQAGIDRGDVYITNAVKHFKFKPIGSGRRLHQKPTVREVKACKPWLEAELTAIRPKVLVCLGATAAQAILGPAFRITKQRGEIMESEFSITTLATYHPSAILRAPDKESRDKLFRFLVDDLKSARGVLAKS